MAMEGKEEMENELKRDFVSLRRPSQLRSKRLFPMFVVVVAAMRFGQSSSFCPIRSSTKASIRSPRMGSSEMKYDRSLCKRTAVTDPETVINKAFLREAVDDMNSLPQDVQAMDIKTKASPLSSTRTGKTKPFKKATARKDRVATKSARSSRSSTMKQMKRNRELREAWDERDERTRASSLSSYKEVNMTELSATRRQARGEALYRSLNSVPESMMHFANEIHREKRITPKEEIILGNLTQEAVRLQELFETLGEQYGRKPTDEEWCAAAGKINMEAIRQTMQEGIEAKNKLVTSNLRMVQGVVNIYLKNGLHGGYSAGDMMMEGVLALIRAAEKFDPGRGFRFSTYAMYWIRSAVKRSQMAQSRAIMLPQRLHHSYVKVVKVEKEMRKELGREPTTKELCERVEMSEYQLNRCKTAGNQRFLSLDDKVVYNKRPNSDHRFETLGDILPSSSEDSATEEFKREILREAILDKIKAHLTPIEMKLVLLRYGLDQSLLPPGHKDGPLTIAEVSRLSGLKPDKVRRMLMASLRRLQVTMGSDWLRETL